MVKEMLTTVDMFQKGCEECIFFMDAASQAISARLEALAKLEHAISCGAAGELLDEARRKAGQCALDCKQTLERVRIHQLAHDSRASAQHIPPRPVSGWDAKLSH